MISCPNCHTQNRDGARYCVKCRQPLPSPGRLSTGPLEPGVLLNNRYRVVGALGQGGMATVYRAEDTLYPGQYRAIKQLHDEGLSPADRQIALQSFSNEAQLLTTLNHPNIPRVWDSFAHGRHLYLVMELFEGQTLDVLIQQRNGKRFDEPTVIQWGIQICDVLTCIHEHNPPIILRDLKPENIVIDPHGNARLIDFGIARVFKPGQGRDTIPLGTPGYAPPEQHSGQTDARSDIYAVGAVMHQLLTGHDPQDAIPFSFKPARQLNLSVSPQMEQVLIRALKNSPAERYQSAREMQQALGALLARMGRRRTDRLPIWVLVGLGIAILLVCSLGIGVTWSIVNYVTATPTLTVTPVPPTSTVTPSPTWTSTSTRPPTMTPIASETPTSTPSPTNPDSSVAGLRANLERLKNFMESSKNGDFRCDTFTQYYNSVVNYRCDGCQRAIDLMRERGRDLYNDCRAQGGTRNVQELKFNSAKAGVYVAKDALPK